MQNYTTPATGATPPVFTQQGENPTLPALIERLQNIHLLTGDLPAGDYAARRSVEELTQNVASAIGLVDSRILSATNPAAL